MSEENGRHFVTNAELERKLDKVPTRWEVRFLILSAFIGGQLVPSIHSAPIKSGIAAAARLLA